MTIFLPNKIRKENKKKFTLCLDLSYKNLEIGLIYETNLHILNSISWIGFTDQRDSKIKN